MPSKIESATIYAQTNDNFTFELRDNGGNVLQTTTVPLVQGANRVNLNFDIPVGNDFELGVPGGHSGMFRHNQGVNYPYDFSNLLSIKSSNSGSPFNFYYFFSFKDFENEIDIKYDNIPHLCSKFNLKKNLIKPYYIS